LILDSRLKKIWIFLGSKPHKVVERVVERVVVMEAVAEAVVGAVVEAVVEAVVCFHNTPKKSQPLILLANTTVLHMKSKTWNLETVGYSRGRCNHHATNKKIPSLRNKVFYCGKLCGKRFKHAPAAISHTRSCSFNIKKYPPPKNPLSDFLCLYKFACSIPNPIPNKNKE